MSSTPTSITGQRRRRWPVWLALGLAGGFFAWWWDGAGHGGDVKRVAHTNPELQAAARRAQSELDSFIVQLQDPRPGERFAIKGAFATPLGPEYLWVRDPVYREGKFTGILDQPPIAYRAAKKGDQVSVARNDVFDWMIRDAGQTRGGYTEQVLAKQQRGQ